MRHLRETMGQKIRSLRRFRAARRGALLLRPEVASVALASFSARLPLSMMGLATVFFVEDKTGSAAVAGFAVAAFSVTAAVVAPWRGRFVDRRGLRHGLLPLALAHAAATGALLLVAPLSSAAVFFVLVSALGGATAPPVNAAMRALWPSLVDADRLDAAYGAEAVLQEIAYLAGPLATGVLVAALSVSAPIFVATILTAVGGSLFSVHRAAARLQPVSAPRRTPHRHAGMRVILGSLVLAALAAGILEVAIPAAGGLPSDSTLSPNIEVASADTRGSGDFPLCGRACTAAPRVAETSRGERHDSLKPRRSASVELSSVREYRGSRGGVQGSHRAVSVHTWPANPGHVRRCLWITTASGPLDICLQYRKHCKHAKIYEHSHARAASCGPIRAEPHSRAAR